MYTRTENTRILERLDNSIIEDVLKVTNVAIQGNFKSDQYGRRFVFLIPSIQENNEAIKKPFLNQKSKSLLQTEK